MVAGRPQGCGQVGECLSGRGVAHFEGIEMVGQP